MHTLFDTRSRLAVVAIVTGMSLQALPAAAADPPSIYDSWNSVAVPPPPPLQKAAVESASTALLILDMNARTCTADDKPTCLRSVPNVKRLLDEARSHKVLVIYSTGPATNATPPKTPDALAPKDGEPIVRTGADKFLGSDLEKILAAKSIRTVIVTGSSAHGAVLYTASGAALRGLQVVVPVDGFSSESPFAELYTAWHLKNAPPTVSSRVTLSRSDMITFR